MNFLKLLEVEMEYATNQESLFDSRYPGGNRICKWININKEYSLSIQASEMHYCIPRAYIPLKEYTHFELAIIFKGKLAFDITVLEKFDRYDELKIYQEDNIFAQVPKDLIEDLYNWWIKNNH
ncbi:MAG: hypothetical protein IJH34_17915 [Romboutsia sp.]|nr:hypothetical protein [Romboutsia sp.]